MKTYREKIVGLALCGALSVLGYSVANAGPVNSSVVPAGYNQQVGPNVKFQNAYWMYYRPYYYHRYYYWHPYRPWRYRYYYRYYWY